MKESQVMKEMPYVYMTTKCSKCGREFLVERVLFGIDHALAIVVTCKECLKKNPLPEQFVKDHPAEAKSIMEWLKT